MAFLTDGMVGIVHQHCERVGEDGRCLVRGNVVLPPVRFGLLRIPIELVAHGETTGKPLKRRLSKRPPVPENRMVGSTTGRGEFSNRPVRRSRASASVRTPRLQLPEPKDRASRPITRRSAAAAPGADERPSTAAGTAQLAARTRDDGTRFCRFISLPPRRGVRVPQLVVSGLRGRAPSPGPLRTQNRTFSLTPTSCSTAPAPGPPRSRGREPAVRAKYRAFESTPEGQARRLLPTPLASVASVFRYRT